MRNLIQYCVIILCLSITAAAATPKVASTDKDFGIVKIPNEYSCPKAHGIDDPPPVKTQGIGICDTVEASYLIETDVCRIKGKKCDTLSPNEQFSILYLSQFDQVVHSAQERADIDRYNQVRFDGDGGSAAVILSNFAASTKHGVKESCAPYAAFLAGKVTGSDQKRSELEMWTNLKKAYFRSKDKTECLECLATSTAKDLHENYKSNATNAEILSAFGEKTYQEFLSKVLIPEICVEDPANTILWVPTGTFLKWPATKAEQTIEGGVKKIKENLDARQPVGVQGICMDDTFNGFPCKESHGVAIYQYCRMCNDNNGNDCIDAVRILNSLGEGWQKRNHNGWVDEKKLLKSLDFQDINKAPLFWIENKTKAGQ